MNALQRNDMAADAILANDSETVAEFAGFAQTIRAAGKTQERGSPDRKFFDDAATERPPLKC
jgi:hypothetical protein